MLPARCRVLRVIRSRCSARGLSWSWGSVHRAPHPPLPVLPVRELASVRTGHTKKRVGTGRDEEKLVGHEEHATFPLAPASC